MTDSWNSVLATIGLALIHFSWITLVVGAFCWAILRSIPSSFTRLRYLFASFVLMVVAMLGPILQIYLLSQQPAASSVDQRLVAGVSARSLDRSTVLPLRELQTSSSSDTVLPISTLAESTTTYTTIDDVAAEVSASEMAPTVSWSAPHQWMGILTWFWLVGTATMLIRMALGWRQVRSWRSTSCPLAGQQTDRYASLAKQIGIRCRVTFLQTSSLTVPIAFGILRPTILIPASLLSSMTVKELDSIVLHELAHIRRWDCWLNTVQVMIEAVYFFHPVVWWLSSVIRAERENQCDDMAIDFCGDRKLFANALLRLEELRQPALVLSAAQAPLVTRIQRICQPRSQSRPALWPSLWTLSVTSLLLLLTVAVPCLSQLQATFQEKAKPSESQPENQPAVKPAVEYYVLKKAGEQVQHLVVPNPDPSTTAGGQQQSLLQVDKPTKIFHTLVEARQMELRLPAQSDIHAELKGKQIQIDTVDNITRFVILEGEIHLIDSDKVLRLRALPDSGAEQLMIESVKSDTDIVLRIHAQFLDPNETITPPVQAISMPTEFEPKKEPAPHHPSPETGNAESSFQFQILTNENGYRFVRRPVAPDAKSANPSGESAAKEPEWGPLAENSQLQARLTILNEVEKLTIGQPLHLKLEVRNQGTQPQSLRTDLYRLRFQRLNRDGFYRTEPLVDSRPLVVAPGQTAVVWDDRFDIDYGKLEPGTYDITATGGQWALGTIYRDSQSLQWKLISNSPNQEAGNQQPGNQPTGNSPILTGTVVDADGTPVPAARLCVTWAPSPNEAPQHDLFEADQQGNFHWNGPMDSTFAKDAASAQWLVSATDGKSLIVRPANSETGNITLQLPKGTEQKLKIIDSSGESANGSLRTSPQSMVLVDPSTMIRLPVPILSFLPSRQLPDDTYLLPSFDSAIAAQWEYILHTPSGDLHFPVSADALDKGQFELPQRDGFWCPVPGNPDLKYHLSIKADNDTPLGYRYSLSIRNVSERETTWELGKARLLLVGKRNSLPLVVPKGNWRAMRIPAESAIIVCDNLSLEAKGPITGELLHLVWDDPDFPTRDYYSTNTISLFPVGTTIRTLDKSLPKGWTLRPGWSVTNNETVISFSMGDDYSVGDSIGGIHFASVSDPLKAGSQILGTMPNGLQIRMWRSLDLEDFPLAQWNQMRQAVVDALVEEHGFQPAPTPGPWQVIGRVTDEQGKPIQGAVIRAHCGIGSLRSTGETTSNANGDYVLAFGPGIRSEGGSLQAATISVSYPGHYEKNLHRHGDLIAALQSPPEPFQWGGKTAEDLVMPDKERRLDFVMVPGQSLKGSILLSTGQPAANWRVSLTGPHLPPSSSVLQVVSTDKEGHFEWDSIPTGLPFQIQVESSTRQSPWPTWASPPVTFESSTDRNKTTWLSNGQTWTFDQLQLKLKGEGVNWRQSLKDAAEETFPLQLEQGILQGTIGQ